jgi:hypothetical protein
MAKTMLSKIPLPATLAHEQGLLETIWLLFTSVLVVPAVCKIPGGSPVLGFLAGGALIGPHALGESMHVFAVWLDMAMMCKGLSGSAGWGCSQEAHQSGPVSARGC